MGMGTWDITLLIYVCQKSIWQNKKEEGEIAKHHDSVILSVIY